MRKLLWIHLLLFLTAAELLAGSAQSLSRGDYTNLNINSPGPDSSLELHNVEKVYFDLDSIAQDKFAIALSQGDEKEKLNKLCNLYEKSLPFLETADDYVKLFKIDECYILMDANENFLHRYYDKFIETNPSVQQLKDVAENVGKIFTAVRLKNYALTMVKSPEEFILIIRGPLNGTDFYRNALVSLAFHNLEIFKKLKPNFNHVLELQTWIINLKASELATTNMTMFGIKRMFAAQFSKDERQCILDYGSNQLSEEHRKDVAWLKDALVKEKGETITTFDDRL